MGHFLRAEVGGGLFVDTLPGGADVAETEVDGVGFVVKEFAAEDALGLEGAEFVGAFAVRRDKPA